MYRLYEETAAGIAELNKLPRAEGDQISARAFNKAIRRPRGYLGLLLLAFCTLGAMIAAGALWGWSDKSLWCIVPLCLGGTIGSLVGGALMMILTGPLYLAYLRQELQARQDAAAPSAP
jgi:hypothetical protein